MSYTTTADLDQNKDLIIPCHKGATDWLKDYISIIPTEFTGEYGTCQLLFRESGRRIYLLGLGAEKDQPKMEDCFRRLAFDCRKNWTGTVQVLARNLTPEQITKATTGLEMANYTIGAFKTKKEEVAVIQYEFVTQETISEAIKLGQLTGETINRIKSLVDAPSNVKTPEYLAQWAVSSANTYNYSCKVLDEAELKKQGFEAVLAVGRGSENKPVVIHTQYKGSPSETVDLALVGKGISFDTGGLSIKPSTNLHYMKSDMGGSAVVLGVMELAARLGLKINISGVVAAAENAVDANSYRPGDVIGSYSGKTIEVIDTDAEGRLVLADAISYAVKNIKPEKMIDLATLTGSVVRTLGYSSAGMFTQNDAMAESLAKIGISINEKVWRLPLFEEFDSELHSDVADYKNLSSKPVAGGSTAAKFLEVFTEQHPSWVHLDIAGVAFGDSHYAKMKSASGYGIRLILGYIYSIINGKN